MKASIAISLSGAVLLLGSFFSVAEAQAPRISVQPTNESVLIGGTASFSVGVSGTGPFTYQWQFKGTNLTNILITTLAGGGANGLGDGGAAIMAELQYPWGVAVDPAGNLFIADAGNNRVRKVGTSPKTSEFEFGSCSLPIFS